ncbi:hypothetical protein Ahy_B09g098719 isoform D [Arachis hypogaea]|uniref:Uncharacterized protein n=1 Tax=Arachis hypogaea TaxID=3818 RepID=A0A444XSN4_ARAHY|nr:hypothetical protein Ahy_B09g098719 isoform D [Arachis hypogaea]
MTIGARARSGSVPLSLPSVLNFKLGSLFMVVQISLMDPLNRRRTSLMEDSTILTIEFLRGRLLFERSISRRARQRAEDLEKKAYFWFLNLLFTNL